jgi:acyl-CoA thioesterase
MGETELSLAVSCFMSNNMKKDMEAKPIELTEWLRGRAKDEPVSQVFDFKVLELSPGHAKVNMKMKPGYLNFNGTVFGGIIMAIADYAFGLAVNSVTHPSIASQFNIYFISRVEANDELNAECHMTKNGKRMGLSEIAVTNQRGDIVAKATGITIPVGK